MRVKILNHTKFWYRNHSQTQFYISFHEERRLLSISLDHAGDWLNTPPLIGLGLHLRPVEFVLVVKYRLGLPVFDQRGPCPACLQESDVLGDHALCSGSGGERISRHNALRDAIFETAVAAGPGQLRRVVSSFLVTTGAQLMFWCLTGLVARTRPWTSKSPPPSRSPQCQELPIRQALPWTTPIRGSLKPWRGSNVWWTWNILFHPTDSIKNLVKDFH